MAGPALASAGPDWKHFCGAPLSGLCRNFLGEHRVSHNHRNNELCERARSENANGKQLLSGAYPLVSRLQRRLSMSVPQTSP